MYELQKNDTNPIKINMSMCLKNKLSNSFNFYFYTIYYF